MNERILELAERAWAYQITVYEDNGVRTYGEQEKVFSKQKFAELIVRECAGRVDNILREKKDSGRTMGDEIREHFGV